MNVYLLLDNIGYVFFNPVSGLSRLVCFPVDTRHRVSAGLIVKFAVKFAIQKKLKM